MNRFALKRLPSPALTLAFVALLAALSGTAIALPGKNTVDSRDLKKGAVKTADIGKNAVRASKVKNDSLTGSDIKESALGAVPNAANAANATNAGNASQLNGVPANGLLRVARAQSNSDALLPAGDNADATVLTTTIAAPGAGFLVINAGADVFGTVENGTCLITVDGTEIASSARTWEINNTGDTNPEEDCTTETTQPVNTGAHTVTLTNDHDLNNAAYDEASLQVLYVPFDGSGNRPAAFDLGP